MNRLVEAFRTPTHEFVRGWTWALVVANIVIVVTGGAVRLSASGLGCPTWPRCTDASFVPHRALGVHGVIEFSNRMLTYVLVAVAIATWIAVWRRTGPGDRRRVLATVIALGIPGQAVVGGITVLTDLNPWVVALHLLLSFALIAASITLVRRLTDARPAPVPAAASWLVRGTYGCLWVVLYVGTVVTGSGPHAGDIGSPRNGLDPAAVTQFHADMVFLLVGLTIGCVALLRAGGAPREAVGAAAWLLVVELAQGLVGFVQYFTDLPIVLVAVHILGAAILVAMGTRLVLTVRPAHSPSGGQRRKGSIAAATNSTAR